MAASMWEVTRLVLGAPGDASGIAQAHGFTTGQVADLMPLFLDNVTTDYDGPADLPPPHPAAGGADAATHWLGEWAGRLASGAADVISYDSFGAPDFAFDGFDPVDLDFDTTGHAVPVHTAAAVPPELHTTFGHGGDAADGPPDGHDDPTHDLGDGGHLPGHPSHVDLDDPFDPGGVGHGEFPATDAGDLHDGLPHPHHDLGPGTDGTADAGGHFH